MGPETAIRPRGAGRWQARAIGAWAEAHYGLVSRRKLLHLGLTRHEIDRRLSQGWLVDAAPGVYYVGHRSGVAGQREALALARGGPGTALDGVSAAAWRRMTDPWPGEVHVVQTNGRTRHPPGVRRHSGALSPGEVTVVRGLACVTPARAVMTLPPDRLPQALQWLLKAGIAVEPIVERMAGRRGARRFRAEAALLVPQMAHTMSELEDRFLRLCRRRGVPLPAVNATLGANGDLLDCVWPGSALVVELDGRRWHEHRWRQDRERDRARTLEGRVPVRYGWHDVTREAARTAAEVLALLRGCDPPAPGGSITVSREGAGRATRRR